LVYEEVRLLPIAGFSKSASPDLGLICYRLPLSHPISSHLLFHSHTEIPTEIFELSKLRMLSVSFNRVNVLFHGIEKAPELEVINVAYTDVKSVAGIENAQSKLYDLHIAGSALTTSFPTEVLQVTSLKKLFLEDNRISGSIPLAIGNLRSLIKLGLKTNYLTGTLPSELGLLTRLDTLDLSMNRLSGFLPKELGNLTNLVSMNLAAQESYNKITGPLYPFHTISTLRYLNVSQNGLVGELPSNLLASVDKVSTVYVTIDLSYNRFTGSIPIEYQTFDLLNIDLASNMINSIPLDLCYKTKWMNGIVGVVLPENQW
jgi:Leucine-rich repeat (LRR) protein